MADKDIPHEYYGWWRIIETSQWANDDIDIIGTALISLEDPLHSSDEERLILFGISYNNRMLIIVHTESGDNIRIISARKAAKKERNYYETNV